jgi:Ca2+-transporting ATPase
MIMRPAWSQTAEELKNHYQVDFAKGLSTSEAAKRLLSEGPNTFGARKKISRWKLLLKQLANPVVYILIVAAAVAFALQEVLDAWAILAIVILNTIIGYGQESKAEAAIEALTEMSAPKAKVLRGGTVQTIPSEDVCVSDILLMEAGDYVPADARIIEARQLNVDEAILTGESLPIEKTQELIDENAPLADRKNMLFASTAISNGSVRAVVTATGINTQIGQIAKLMDTTQIESTPLQQRLEAVSRKLLWVGGAVVILVGAIGAWRGQPWIDIVMSALSLSVAAIPEGLPTMVTVALVMAVNRMSKKHALVRKMDSVETLGATDIICTDKTGTLTTGKMQVRETSFDSEAEGEKLLLNFVLCNNASISGAAIGDSTEVALLEFAQKEGLDVEKIRAARPRQYEWSFDSDRKRMSVASSYEGRSVIYTKGAPEAVLSQCLLTKEQRERVAQTVSEYSKKGMRVLAYAQREVGHEVATKLKSEEAESELQFIGLSAIADPPRSESLEAVQKCQHAGIRVIMITGDHPQTAAAIAAELGIISNSEERVLTGVELDQLSIQELSHAVETVSVYARVSPSNKLQLVDALKAQGHVVAMTGDGVNDAPALKRASIGVAMGKGGTEVARQAASMVLTDDNFATIVDAVEEGRAVNGNIKRTLQYLLSTNLAELLFILSAVAIGWEIPLLPVNLLWLNLVSDGLPSLALAAEKVPYHYLEENTKPSPKSFFDRSFYVELVFVGILITVMSLLVYGYGLEKTDIITARSMAFTFLVFAILFRSFSCRSDVRTFFEMKPNFYHLASVFGPVIIQYLLQSSETARDIFGITALSLEVNLGLLGFSLIPVTIIEVFKIWRRR